jgi:hypothetical protein
MFGAFAARIKKNGTKEDWIYGEPEVPLKIKLWVQE